MTPADPGEQNCTVVAYTVVGTAHGQHADNTDRKIVYVCLYIAKKTTAPPVSVPNSSSPGSDWVLKWTENANPTSVTFGKTWNVMYIAAGDFWWLGGTTDDWEQSPPWIFWANQPYNPLNPGDYTSHTNRIGPYYTN